jgi:hypothetical protein
MTYIFITPKSNTIYMTDVFFNANGGPLSAKAIFLGDLVADYGMFLKEANSNAQVLIMEGDNLNPQDDIITLPTPVGMNAGRRVKLETAFLGNHPDINTDYRIVLEIHQDGNLIGKEEDPGQFTGRGQVSLLFIRLIPQ